MIMAVPPSAATSTILSDLPGRYGMSGLSVITPSGRIWRFTVSTAFGGRPTTSGHRTSECSPFGPVSQTVGRGTRSSASVSVSRVELGPSRRSGPTPAPPGEEET